MLRWLFLPFSLLYALAVYLRNFFYNHGIFKSRTFNLPVISVGNIAVGGSGKSPVTEYLIRLLNNRYHIATLSRGYGRQTKGFLQLTTTTSATDGGDEPVQFKQKFPAITVAVCEDRVKGIEQLRQNHDIILLDDAYQHRVVKPGLSILLFDYNRLHELPLLLPAGNLREPRSSKNRADVIIVTKTPANLDNNERQKISRTIRPLPKQQLFFSYLQYGNLLSLHDGHNKALETITPQTGIIVLTGIAYAEPLLKELQRYTSHIRHIRYPDHHTYTTKNISKLAEIFNAWPYTEKLIITTEKDSQRLRMPEFKQLLNTLPVYYLPVEAHIHQPDEHRFNQLIELYVRKYRNNY